VFGPSQAASQLEGSKIFAKDVMGAGGVATGAYSRHETADSALAHLGGARYPLVIKADGLAAGKGVLICADAAEAEAAVKACFVSREFGDAGDLVIIEEYLTGSEVSLLVLCDGKNAVPLAPAQDYKRIFAGDQGPNTGGMGSYCPVPGFEQQAIDAAMEHVVEPVVAALRDRGIVYRGVLYAGLIVTEAGVKVLEFNCRFGDPETQAVLPRLDSDLLELCAAASAGELAGVKAAWKPQECVTVVMASAGYPASSHKGDVITGLDAAGALDDVTVFHAGTALMDGEVVTAGGRVLAVSALGRGFAEARERAYQGIGRISFDGSQIRADIAERAVRAVAGEISLFPAGLGR
jgi:phosphoribosylamine---glycine ligase